MTWSASTDAGSVFHVALTIGRKDNADANQVNDDDDREQETHLPIRIVVY